MCFYDLSCLHTSVAKITHTYTYINKHTYTHQHTHAYIHKYTNTCVKIPLFPKLMAFHPGLEFGLLLRYFSANFKRQMFYGFHGCLHFSMTMSKAPFAIWLKHYMRKCLNLNPETFSALETLSAHPQRTPNIWIWIPRIRISHRRQTHISIYMHGCGHFVIIKKTCMIGAVASVVHKIYTYIDTYVCVCLFSGKWWFEQNSYLMHIHTLMYIRVYLLASKKINVY